VNERKDLPSRALPAHPLLTTKLHAPPVRSGLVPRPRLTQRLNEGLTRKLTLLSAPAGFGKTTLLAEWIADCRFSIADSRLPGAKGLAIANRQSPIANPVAWLSLNPADNDPTRFLTYLIAALQSMAPGTGQTAQELLHAPQSPAVESVLTLLVNDLCALTARGEPGGRHYVLVLEDYHTITVAAIHEAVTFLLDSLPPSMHLVIATRADPPLPLARLRARGQMVEIRADDLRFTPDEAAVFLQQVMGLSLSAEDVATLEARTEGWIVGLQLAALSMQGRDARSVSDFLAAFSGSHHYVVDYLADEVINRQPDAVREFLLPTSILERLSGPLCDAVLGTSESAKQRSGESRDVSSPFAHSPFADSQAILEYLEQANLFVTPLDEERRWFRYHHLFADVLRSRLRQVLPDRLPELHRRAAEWYEKNGFVSEAISHALAAGDRDRAAQLVEQNALPMLMRGELVTLLDWIKAIEALIHDHPWLAIHQAWALTLTGQLDRVEPLLQAAEHCISSCDPATEVKDMLGHIAAVRAYGAAMQGDALRAIGRAQQAFELLPESNLSIRSVVAFILGGACWLSGDFTGASCAFAEAGRNGQAAGNLHLAAATISALADLMVGQGQLRQAAETYRQALQVVTRPNGRRLPVAARACAGLGGVFYEWNDLEAATQYARHCIELCPQWGNVDSLTTGYVLLARIRRAQGNRDSVLDAMREAEQLTRERSLHPGSASHVETFRVSLWLAQGNLEAASRWAQESGIKIDDEIDQMRYAEYGAFAHVLLAQGEHAAALRLLERLRHTAEAAGRMGLDIVFLVLQSLTLQAKDDIPQAMIALERALSLAQPEGYVRTFLDEGAPMAKLLRRAGSRGIMPGYVTQLLSAMAGTFGTTSSIAQPLIEPLSEREREVLRLVASGLSNRQIAHTLYVAESTVKSHINAIFCKLEAQNRTQAVARARELHLL
jgi:LuxR family maltose regulon positive regulatory protein